ncbi:VPS10 domain-containing protein [Prevotella sp.]|uniref:VPS10 domain-containing protein n=1 Tax=Prevotella sp. TaxID=59823 RepID=UPI002F94E91C
MPYIINKIKTACLSFSLLLLGGQAVAQDVDATQYHPYAPVGIPNGAPKWMERLTDVENVNYHAMVDSFEAFKHDHPEMRRKTPMTKAVINYFKRWQKTYRPYVTPSGKIAMPAFKDYRKFVEDMNAQGQQQKLTRAASGSKWEVLSPLMTYHPKTKEPYNGQANIQRFDVYKKDPNILYAGAETGMIFKTTDKGLNWTSCTPDFFFGGDLKTVEISYTDPNKVVIGAGSFLWLTTDGGNKWKDITPKQLRNVNAMIRDAVFHPTDDKRMIVGNDKGLYQSTDNGETWTQLLSGMCFDIKYKHDAPNVIYTLIRQGRYVEFMVSNDGGQNFQKQTPAGYQLASGRIGLSSAPTGREYIYIIACRFDNYSDAFQAPYYFGTPILFKSTDGGQNWEHNDNLKDGMASYEMARGQGYYDMMISASSKNPEQVLFGMIDFYRSDDGGKTIMHKGGYSGQFNIHFDMQDVHIVDDDAWVSSDGGLVYSSDFFTKHYDARINGIYASEFLGFDQGWNEDVIVGGRYHNGDMAQMDKYNGAAIHLGGGEQYTGYVLLSDPHRVAFSDANPKNVILPDDWHKPFESFPDFLRYPYESSLYGMGMEFDPRYAKSFLIFQGHGDERRVLWKTVDDGQSFVELYTFPSRINSHVISRSNPDKIVVSTLDNFYQSLDGGKTFQPFATIPDGVRNSMQLITAIHPRNEDEIWISALDNPACIYRTLNNGKTWELMDKGLELPSSSGLYNAPGEKVAIHRFFLTGNEKDAVYAIGYVIRPAGKPDTYISRGRVFYRDNTTDGWQDYSEGLPQVINLVRMLPFYKKGKIRIATNNGVWQRDLVDPEFKPIAQPLILNAGTPDNKGSVDLYFDSYSIVNQKDAKWNWKFNPQPLKVSDPTARNPIVRIEADQSYDVTLTVTTPEGSDTKTIKKMIVGKKDVPTSIAGQEVLKRDILLAGNAYTKGEPITLEPQNINAACKWQLFNAQGAQVGTQTIAATGTTHIATDRLASGIYFYLITSKSFRKTGKLIIK